MTRIYSNRSLGRRANGSLVVVLSSFLFGAFEIWRAVRLPPEVAESGYLFGLLFLGGGVYGLRLVLMGNRDGVVSFERDADNAIASVWRPFGTTRIAGPIGRFTDFRPYAKQVRRHVKMPVVLVDHPEHPRPLEFELGQGIEITEGFRALAGDAVASFEGDAAPSA